MPIFPLSYFGLTLCVSQFTSQCRHVSIHSCRHPHPNDNCSTTSYILMQLGNCPNCQSLHSFFCSLLFVLFTFEKIFLSLFLGTDPFNGSNYPFLPKKAKKNGQQLQQARTCGLKIHQCDFNTQKSDFHPQSVILHAECDFHTHTHTSVILTLTNGITRRSSLIYTNVVLKFQHECDFNTIDFYMQITISTRVDTTHTREILTRIRVNKTLTTVITTRSNVIYTRRV
jgi:hypothetical protein